MLGLFISTVLTSAADSLNPIAITQQFVLQGLVKKPKHIWYFIVSIGLTNFAGGLLAYFGLASLLEKFVAGIIARHSQTIFLLELATGVVLCAAAGYLVQSARINSLKKRLQEKDNSMEEKDQKAVAQKIKSVTPLGLIILGVAATISELATALPYFAFLAILFNFNLPFVQILVLLIVYNIVYSLPLIVLYFVYVKAQSKFDQFYVYIKNKIAKWASATAPAAVGGIGLFLILHALSLLI